MYVQDKHTGNITKIKSIKPKLLETSNLNSFQTSWSSDFFFRGLSLENENLINGQNLVTVGKI